MSDETLTAADGEVLHPQVLISVPFAYHRVWRQLCAPPRPEINNHPALLAAGDVRGA